MQPAFAAVDWGTTSFRLWLLDGDGRVCGESAGPDGMTRATGLFPEILAAHLGAAGAPADLPVLICGMAGARQGWVEAPYLPLPARLDRLHEAAIRVPVPGDIRILPGLSQNDPAAPNVMRGEETQLLGLPPSDGTRLVCMPGTHCKWTRMEGGTVTRFTTAMTGELFAALSQHTVLRHSVKQSQTPADAPAFLAALDLVLDAPASLVTRLFELRAGQLLEVLGRQDGAAHLSGLLIGAEIGALRPRLDAPILLAATGPLAGLYAAALTRAGLPFTTFDAAEATRRGLALAGSRIWSTP